MTLSWQVCFLLLGAVLVAGDLLVGAPFKADLKSEDVQNALKLAVEHYNADNHPFLSEVVEVINAEEQIVEGILYMFTVKMVHTSCKTDVKDCPETGKPFLCQFDVQSIPWLKETRFVRSQCQK